MASQLRAGELVDDEVIGQLVRQKLIHHRFNSNKGLVMVLDGFPTSKLQVSRDLQLQSTWRISTAAVS